MGKTKEKGSLPLPEAVDVLIIGAGPHGLAMASRLLLGQEAMQDVIAPQESYVRKPSEVRAHLKKKRKLRPEQLAVIDSSGGWMKRWQNQFQALGIEYLRSNEMMHPDAFDHSSLPVWAHANKRNDFLFLEDLPKDRTYHGPFTLPSNRMMVDFCRHLVKFGCLEERLWPGLAESIEESETAMIVTVRIAGEIQRVVAQHVVVARGPTWRRQWPQFYHTLETASISEIRHAWDLFDNPEQLNGLRGKGVIVGGGLTSAHLCAQLAPRGSIDLLIRRDLRIKQYDLDLFWMGSGRRSKRTDFEQAPIEERAAMNKAVRDGGSITPELHTAMSKLMDQGLLKVHEYTEVVTASFDEGWTIVLTDDEVMSADYLICASGTVVDIFTDPLLADLQKMHPLNMYGPLPMLTENLQWGDLPVYIMGNVAALQLGPDAVNMNGASRGALRIASAIGHRARSDSGSTSTTASERMEEDDRSTDVGSNISDLRDVCTCGIGMESCTMKDQQPLFCDSGGPLADTDSIRNDHID